MTTQTKVESESHRSNAFGRTYAGTFTATAVAKTFSRAAHFQTTPVPVTARLSGESGDPRTRKSGTARREAGRPLAQRRPAELRGRLIFPIVQQRIIES